MKKLNELAEMAEAARDLGVSMDRVEPATILAIAKAFQALEQENSELRQQRAGLAKEANDLEAKLAELAKQEPVAYWHHSGQVVTREECHDEKIFAICCKVERPLFTRPAPAADLAELVPDPAQNKYWDNLGYGTRFKVRDYHNDVVAILRKIEEAR